MPLQPKGVNARLSCSVSCYKIRENHTQYLIRYTIIILGIVINKKTNKNCILHLNTEYNSRENYIQYLDTEYESSELHLKIQNFSLRRLPEATSQYFISSKIQNILYLSRYKISRRCLGQSS